MGLSANPKSKQTTKDNTTFYSLKKSSQYHFLRKRKLAKKTPAVSFLREEMSY